MAKTVHFVRCYASGASIRSDDFNVIPLEDARKLVYEDHAAELFGHGKHIRMFALREIKPRDRSCGWQDRLVHLNAVGNYQVRKMTEMLDPRFGRIDRIRIVAA